MPKSYSPEFRRRVIDFVPVGWAPAAGGRQGAGCL